MSISVILHSGLAEARGSGANRWSFRTSARAEPTSSSTRPWRSCAVDPAAEAATAEPVPARAAAAGDGTLIRAGVLGRRMGRGVLVSRESVADGY